MGELRGVWVYHLSSFFFFAFTITTCFASLNLTAVSSCFEKERLALLKFKHSVKDPSGMLSSWVGIDCCSWSGVGCDGATGHVVSLRLIGNSDDDSDDFGFQNGVDFQRRCLFAKDVINSALAELRHLNYLDLSGNAFGGSPIPKFIGSFKQLKYLNLSYSSFSDTIPRYLSNLSNLIVLDLGSNYLLADDISWLSSLLSLRYLDLSGVMFSGNQILTKLVNMIPSLLELHLSWCGLVNIHLETSQLNSSSALHHIEHLDLRSNLLAGAFPNFLRNMTSLVSLDLSYNNFSHSRSFEKLCNMIPSLSELYLSKCQLENRHLSPVHVNFSKHSNIQILDLSHNKLNGEFRGFFMNMSSLRSLDLSHNLLNSYGPAMPSLLKLDLSYNTIEQFGNIGMWKLCQLKELRATNNQIRGEMIGSSTNISQCSQYALTFLDLSSNQFNRSIPEALEKFNALEELNLNWNQLSGLIPQSLRKLTALKALYLSWNQLSGLIPESLGKLTALEALSLMGIN